MAYVVVKETTVYAFCGNVHSVNSDIVLTEESLEKAISIANDMNIDSSDYGVKFYSMDEQDFMQKETKHSKKSVDGTANNV